MNNLKVELTIAALIVIGTAFAIYQGVNAQPNPTQSQLKVTTQTQGQFKTVNPQLTVDGTTLQDPATATELGL